MNVSDRGENPRLALFSVTMAGHFPAILGRNEKRHARGGERRPSLNYFNIYVNTAVNAEPWRCVPSGDRWRRGHSQPNTT